MIKIDKGVPIPETCTYPVSLLEVGDSFWVAGNKRNSVMAITARVSRRSNKRFISRKDGDGFRFWRTE